MRRDRQEVQIRICFLRVSACFEAVSIVLMSLVLKNKVLTSLKLL